MKANPLLPLRTRTEFSGKRGLCSIKELVASAKRHGNTHLAITDTTCFGHVQFEKECNDAGIVPIFGLERCDSVGRPLVLLANSPAGLRQIYEMSGLEVITATHLEKKDITFLHHPAASFHNPRAFCMVGPGLVGSNPAGNPLVAVSWPYYLEPEDHAIYEIHNPREPFCFGHHHMTLSEAATAASGKYAIALAKSFKPFKISRGSAPEVRGAFDLRGDCLLGAAALGLELTPEYLARLEREIHVIEEKGFQGYFQMVSDLTGWAKSEGIFLGPGRGSAGGSLVAYLLGITEVDPIKFHLLFERFLDPTRSDVPDIDLDFPDDRRDEIFAYLKKSFGADHATRLGTVLRYGGKSALKEGAKALKVEDVGIEDLGEMVYTPLAGEDKTDCLKDVLESEAGAPVIKTSPELLHCCELEGRVKTTGIHAAGIVITPEQTVNYAAVVDGVAQIDMHDAEDLGLVKLDCLGLRTMGILARACALLGWDYARLLSIPLEDQDALGEFLQQNYAGIFQWEGGTLRSLTDQTPPDCFEDLVLLTSIARPGPLQAGMGSDFHRVKRGTFLGPGPMWGNILSNSHGILAYQEQVMALLYRLGFQDKEVGILRKAMSKSKINVLAEYEAEFMRRASAFGYGLTEASACWDQIKGVGAYLFNRSHAVAYTMISLWCAYLKAHHPMEFYCAAMDRAPTPEAGAEMLREMTRKKISFTVIDPERSAAEWTIQDGMVIGALTAIPGFGPAKCADVIKRRAAGTLTPLMKERLSSGITIFTTLSQSMDTIAAARTSPSVPLVTMEECKKHGGWVLGFVESRFLIDYSSPKMIQKYGACKPGREKSLALTICDEQDSVKATLTGRSYASMGERMEGVPDKLWGYFNLSRWEKNGKLYLNDYRSLA